MEQVIAQSKRAYFDYFIDETYQAGMVLEGWEAKALSNRKISINEAYVRVIGEEVFLIGATISSDITMKNGFKSVDSTRTRKLLLNKREISKLIGKVERAGFTLIPINVHRGKGGKFKLLIGLAKGKKLYDKRESLKKQDVARDTTREI